MATFYIYGITKDDGNVSDPDAAIDKYHYIDSTDDKCYWDYRQNVVEKVKSGSVVAHTYRDGKVGALCIVKHSYIYNIDYLKTLPNGDPTDNLSSLPEM
ncbi:DUF3892 domain-containing protein [Candidatus Saccharibacteria bacterium]|nr:DUF3892 domain-containing protein [Candidatus Saccharibacteria bacterium]